MDELYNQIIEAIKKGQDLINAQVKDAEAFLAKFIRNLLSDYNNKGILEFDDSDARLSKRIRDAVNEAIGKSGFLQVAPMFTPLIEEIERITKRIAELVNPGVKFGKELVDLTQEKKLIIEQIAASLSSPASIKANITSQLQQIIYQSIKNQITYNDALNIISPLIQGDSAAGGLLSRYYKTITMDTLNQWNGAVNQAIATKYGLIDYRYIGEIRKNSRPQCIRWVRSLNSVLVKEVIEAEMAKAVKTVRKSTSQFQGYSIYNVPTVGNFPLIRGGHNCRHIVSAFLATEEEAQEAVNMYNALGNAVKLKYQDIRKD